VAEHIEAWYCVVIHFQAMKKNPRGLPCNLNLKTLKWLNVPHKQKFPQRSSLTATTQNPLLFLLTTTLLPPMLDLKLRLLRQQAQTQRLNLLVSRRHRHFRFPRHPTLPHPHPSAPSLLTPMMTRKTTPPKTTTTAMTVTMTTSPRVQLVSQRRKNGNVHAEKVRNLLVRKILTHCVLFVTDTDCDGDGMHHDVHVADIASESESERTHRPNKNNPSVDIEEFFEKVPHRKGDKKGRRRCKSCT
jgi:hypothetical protein